MLRAECNGWSVFQGTPLQSPVQFGTRAPFDEYILYEPLFLHHPTSKSVKAALRTLIVRKPPCKAENVAPLVIAGVDEVDAGDEDENMEDDGAAEDDSVDDNASDKDDSDDDGATEPSEDAHGAMFLNGGSTMLGIEDA